MLLRRNWRKRCRATQPPITKIAGPWDFLGGILRSVDERHQATTSGYIYILGLNPRHIYEIFKEDEFNEF
jgi:hypothetical protein